MGSAGSSLRFALVLLAACGSVKGADTDAPGPDADLGGDATVVAETALFGGTVGARVGDIDIISTLPNNTVLAMAKTAADGSATIRVYPGGMVTAVYRHTIDMGADLITWVGVQPGDTLTFGSRLLSAAGQTNTNLGLMNYSWPAQPNATAYNIVTSCIFNGVGPPATSFAGNEYSNCHKEPMDVLFAAFNANGISHYSFRSNVPFTNGGSVAATSWTPMQMATVNVTGLPPEVTAVSGSFVTVLDGNYPVNFSNGYSGTPTGGAFAGSFAWHGTGERTVGTLSLGRSGFAAMRVVDSFGASTLTQTVAAPVLTPWLQGNVAVSSALGKASWFLVPNDASVHDGQLLRATWSHTVSGTPHPHQWNFIVPPDQTSLSFPKLPAQFSENVPFPQDNLNATLRVFDIGSVTGYDMVRALPSGTVMCLDCALRAGDLQRVVYTP